MATTGTQTVRNIITMALRKAQLTGFGQEPSSDDAEVARQELNVMLKGWQNKGFNLWTKTSMSHTLTAGAEQTLDPVRPLTILSCRFKRSASASELPMTQMTRDEYDTLPVKTTTGTPTQFYYDRQREAARLYVWPVLATAAGETLQITYEREIEDIATLNDTIDMPGEWWDAVVYSLAARLGEDTSAPTLQSLTMRAEVLLREAGAFDREGSVFFAGPYAS